MPLPKENNHDLTFLNYLTKRKATNIISATTKTLFVHRLNPSTASLNNPSYIIKL